jgi:hypothetical protein
MEKQDINGDNMGKSIQVQMPKQRQPLKVEPHTPMVIQARLIANPQDLVADRQWKLLNQLKRNRELVAILKGQLK